jgi:hypothetical protein
VDSLAIIYIHEYPNAIIYLTQAPLILRTLYPHHAGTLQRPPDGILQFQKDRVFSYPALNVQLLRSPGHQHYFSVLASVPAIADTVVVA